MSKLSSLFLSSVLTIFALSAAIAWAGEDKGTIGIKKKASIRVACTDSQGIDHELAADLEGPEWERAVREYQACVRPALEQMTDTEIGTTLLLMEKTLQEADGGVNHLLRGYSIYRNELEQLKIRRAAEKKKEQEKKTKPRKATIGGKTQ